MEKINYLQCPFGKIKLKINNEEKNFICKELNIIEKNDEGMVFYDVDKRFALIIENLENNEKITTIKCFVDELKNNISGYPDTGEYLEMISFEYDNIILSIGIEANIYFEDPEYPEYIYENNGIKIIFNDKNIQNKIIFGIAWKTINDYKKENSYTWYAADPGLMKLEIL
jgi:hypothetical protein